MRGFDHSPHCRNDDNTGYGASQNRCIGDRSKVLDEHGAAAADLVRRTAAPFLFLVRKVIGPSWRFGVKCGWSEIGRLLRLHLLPTASGPFQAQVPRLPL